MDIVDILITIGLIIYIFAALRKKKRAAKKKDAPARSGWLGKIETFIDEVKKEMEEAAAEEERRERQAPGHMDGMEPGKEELPDFFAKEAPPQAPPPLPEEEPYRREIYETYERHEEPSFEQGIPEPVPVEPAPPIKKRKIYKKKERAFKQKQLQKAVVWSEILSPPIALKEEPPR